MASLAQNLNSAWLHNPQLLNDTSAPLRPFLAPWGRSVPGPFGTPLIQAGVTIWSTYFWPQPPVWAAPLPIGPGISPNAILQFRGLLPYSNFIQHTIVPLTGQSIASTAGSLVQGFVGTAFTSSTGTLTPSISVALSASGRWQNAAGVIGLWANAGSGTSTAQLVRSAWGQTAAGATIWNNYWWATAPQTGGWSYPGGAINSATGQLLPFGVPLFAS